MKVHRFWWLLLAIMVLFGGYRADAASSNHRQIYTLDVTYLQGLDRRDPRQARLAWDTMHLVASLQGIVNREQPRLFVRFMKGTDDFWLDHLRQRGNWLADAEVVRIHSVEELLKEFRPHIRGIVVYHEAVPATSNLASTIAGIEDRICLRYDEAKDSIYTKVMGMNLGAGDVVRLFKEDGSPLFTGRGNIPDTHEPSTGSAKCDAYLWARKRYIETKRCSPDYMAYYIDCYWLRNPTECSLENYTLSNHDFFISQRAFFFDLGMWEEEAPVDEPGQAPGTDVRTLRSLMRSMHDRAGGKIIHIGGFVPWAWKYTDHGKAGGRHGGVDSEWKYAQIISSYNGIMDADAIGISGMANASFYQHYPLKKHYPQNRKPAVDDLKKAGLILADGAVAPDLYVLFYMGDYDSAAWLNVHVPLFWKDPARGTIPCAWAFNPNLDRRAPHVMDYVRSHQSPSDWFIAGDSGAGYLNPGMLLRPRPDDLPDGLARWVEHNTAYYNRYDLSITGFVIDGHSPGMGERGLDAYLRFSPDGIVGQKVSGQSLYRDIMPVTRMTMDLDGPPKEAGKVIADLVGANRPKFAVIRTILKSPTWHKEAMAAARASTDGQKIRFVDPYTFFLLLKTHERNRAAGRADQGTRREVSFAAPSDREGLSPVSVDDGPFARGEHDGRGVIHQKRPGGVRYVYFETSDSFASNFQGKAGVTAVVKVSLMDTTGGMLGLEYDSHGGNDAGPHDGAYRSCRTHQMRGSGQWVDVVFELPSARFAHRQNGGADFRLVNHGAEVLVHKVTVERK